jgi:hypothetical protein
MPLVYDALVRSDDCRIKFFGSIRTTRKCILEANIKGGVGVRCESISVLTDNILWLMVVIANGVTNLLMPGQQSLLEMGTGLVDLHACSIAVHLP